MTSADNQQYITVELFNSKMDNLITQIQLGNEKLRNELRGEFHNEISSLKTEIRVNSAKIEMLEHTFYWGFALMTLVIAVVAVFVPYLLKERKDKIQEKSTQPALTEQRVQEMIQNALSKIGHIKSGEAQ